MLRFVKEFQKYVLITGFRKVRIDNPQEFLKQTKREVPLNVEIQFFDAENIATWRHLYFAILNALTVFRNGVNVSRSPAMETLVYASAQKQIRKATEILGVKPTSTKIAVLMIGEKTEDLESTLSELSRQIKAEKDETVLDLTEEKMTNIRRIFDVTREEISTVMRGRELKDALVDLVIERMALLAAER